MTKLEGMAALRRMIEWAEAVVSPDNEDFRRDAGEARDTLARFDRAVGVAVVVEDGALWTDGVEFPRLLATKATWRGKWPFVDGDSVTVWVLPAGPGEGEGRG